MSDQDDLADHLQNRFESLYEIVQWYRDRGEQPPVMFTRELRRLAQEWWDLTRRNP